MLICVLVINVFTKNHIFLLSLLLLLSFWMKEDFVDAWNISDMDMDGEEIELVNRTSNGLRGTIVA